MAEKKKTSKKKKKESKKEETERVEPRPGDTIRVHFQVKEDDKERTQVFEGVLIAQKGKEKSKTITVRKIAAGGVGVEKIFPLASPKVEKVEVVKQGKARRAKLYYLRERPTLRSVKSKQTGGKKT